MIAFITILAQLISFNSFAGADDLAYFKQFLFAKESTSPDPDFPAYQYRYLMANPKFTNAKQENVVANISLILFADGHFEYTYREMIMKSPTMGMPNGCKTFKGQWSVPSTDLVIEKVGTGTRGFIAGQYPPQTVKMAFEQNFISAGLKGLSTDFTYGISNVETDSQFCF